MHPLVLEADEMQDYPEAGWTELIETMKAGSTGAQWRCHGVSRGVRDTYYRMTTGDNPDLPFKVHRFMAPHRPTWSDAERRAKIAIYGGTEDNVDYRRNIFGEHGDTHNPVFVLARLMACVRINESAWATEYNESVYHCVKINDERHRKLGMPIEGFLDNIPGTHLSEEYSHYWAGMDVGYTNDPSEILVFGVTKKGVLRLLLRVQLLRIGAIDQAMIVLEIFRVYGKKLKAFSMDKMQPVSEPVLTPAGWSPIGELRVGDQVVGSDGLPTTVTGVFPQKDRRVCRVTFTDGSWTRCGPEHLWRVRPKGRSWRAAMTQDLRPGDAIPRVAPVQFADGSDLPVDPYLLGALLGDGNLRKGSVRFSNIDPEVLAQVETRLPLGCVLKPAGRCDYELRADRVRDANGRWVPGNPLIIALRNLDLLGKRSWEKCIPQEYLTASVPDRLALLRGLMDTDGYASEQAHVAFTTSSPGLAQGVVHLVQSLGGTARVRVKSTTGRDQQYVSIQLPEECNPFLLSRKAVRFVSTRSKVRVVAAVSQDVDEDSVCIRVAAEDSLYVTRGFLLTHNTGNGLPLWQAIRDPRLDPRKLTGERLKGYGFSEKRAVEFEDRPLERGEKPEDAVIEKNVVDYSTDELRKLVDQQLIELPYDLELLTEWQGQQVHLVKDMGSAGAVKRKYSDGGFHTLDAGRVMVLGKSLEAIEGILERPTRRGPVLDAFFV